MNIEVVEEEADAYFFDEGGIGDWLLGGFAGFEFVDNFLSEVKFDGIDEFVVVGHGAEQLLLVEMLFVHRRL